MPRKPSWATLNRERGLLIDKKIAGTITVAESVRLVQLQRLAEAWVAVVAPRDTKALEELEALVGMEPRSSVFLTSLTEYCREHPEMKFFEALAAWQGATWNDPHHCGCPLGGPHAATCPTVLGDTAREGRP